MKLATAMVIALVVGITATVAAGAVKDPSRLILRQTDLPRADYEADDGLDSYLKEPLQAAGLSGRAAQYLAVSFSPRKGSLQVSGVVLTVETAAQAKRVFVITKTARDRFARRNVREWQTVPLPSYGDQQVAWLKPPGNEGIAVAELIVRENTVVWLLYINLERRPKPPTSELIADVKRYAAKQKQRVGVG